MSCTPCRLGRTWECDNNGSCNGTPSNLPNWDVSDDSTSSSSVDTDSESSKEDSSEYEYGQPLYEVQAHKPESALRDQQSTGRKRAAEMYPLYRDLDCEWMGRKNCGGGKSIVGCMEGKQQARHHGPDKNTLNNDVGNVHRICHSCHANWHAANDPGYVWGGVYDPNTPVEASEFELMMEQVRRAGVTLKKVED